MLPRGYTDQGCCKIGNKRGSKGQPPLCGGLGASPSLFFSRARRAQRNFATALNSYEGNHMNLTTILDFGPEVVAGLLAGAPFVIDYGVRPADAADLDDQPQIQRRQA